MQPWRKSAKGDAVAQFDEDEIMTLAIEQLEGEILPERFARLDKLLAENSEAGIFYRDMIALRTGLSDLFGKKSKTPDIPAPQNIHDYKNV